MHERQPSRGAVSSIRRRLSYANVTATTAVFIALGGGAYAVTLGRNSVGSRQIAKNAVGTSELKDNGTKGRDIAESTLAQVPSAAHADAAASANSATTAQRATSADAAATAQTATSADNALALGGVPASGYQGFCKAGAIKASVVVNTTGLGPNFVNVPGYNCFQPGNLTSSVQVKRGGMGTYIVRFVGNTGPDNSGSAIVSYAEPRNGFISYATGTNVAEAPGETAFFVSTSDNLGAAIDNTTFSLLAY